jgi:hypothetical protein
VDVCFLFESLEMALNFLKNVSKSSNNGDWVPTIMQTLSKALANEFNLVWAIWIMTKIKLNDYTHLVNKTFNVCHQTCQAS